MPKKPEYTMTISLSILDDLGINLYSNIPAVLSEVVANSWDADASEVKIVLDKADQTITITDDGHGMSKDDVNSKYLHVGYRRRKAEPTVTRKKRHVMGRKGIGKLSLFSIADTIEVRSVKRREDGEKERCGCVMSAKGVVDAIRTNSGVYHPIPIDPSKVNIESGTKIVLRNLKRHLDLTEPYLRKRLARRFSIIGDESGFQVVVNTDPITVEDRDYFKDLEYLWYIGEGSEKYKAWATNCKKSEYIDGIVDSELGYRISGWVGTFKEQRSPDEWDNRIVVLAWGKLIHEDLLRDLKEAGIYATYLIGEIRADFLDLDTKDDIATSDRQSLKETDPRFAKLKEYVQKNVLKEIQKRWTTWRTADAEDTARKNPAIDEWFRGLRPDNKKYATDLFGKIESFPISDPAYKKELYRHAIIAFETLALKQNLSVLEAISTREGLETLSSLFASMDELEETHYYQIVQSRVQILSKFETLVDTNAKERVVQEHIFNHLWLLHPSWERASTDERMEERIKTDFAKIDARFLTADEEAARLDIGYRTAAGKDIIVELKRYGARVDALRLLAQLEKYYDALSKLLKEAYPDDLHQIEIVCVLGSPPTPVENDQRYRDMFGHIHARYLTYDHLIRDTRKGYQDYLDISGKIRRIQQLIDSI